MERFRHINTDGLPEHFDVSDLLDTGINDEDLIAWFKDRMRPGPPELTEEELRSFEKKPKPKRTVEERKEPPKNQPQSNVQPIQKPETEPEEHLDISSEFSDRQEGTDSHDLQLAVGPEEVKRQKNDQVLISWPPKIKLKKTSHPYTDASNAQRFVRQFAREILNIDDFGWHRWDGSRWIHDEHYVDRCAQEIGRLIRNESIQNAIAANDTTLSSDERGAANTRAKALLSWAKKSESLYRITATKKLAEAHLSYKPAQFDTDPWLLNCLNGTVDLRNGELRPARRCDLITKSTGVPYDPQASYNFWEETVLDICCGDVELMRYLQRVMGYCLTGMTTEQVMFIFNGGGSNGKDTFLGRVKNAMGGLCRVGGSEPFDGVQKRQAPHRIG